jgi:hypothetical protein
LCSPESNRTYLAIGISNVLSNICFHCVFSFTFKIKGEVILVHLVAAVIGLQLNSASPTHGTIMEWELSSSSG